MIVTKPDPYLLPTYRLSPFTTADIHRNARLPESAAAIAEAYFKKRFTEHSYYLLENGRAAIAVALATYDLKPDDVVTILTTTDNYYISGCVTKEIEKFCGWSREIVDQTKLLFVNHEFGFARTDLEELKTLGFPIIEDCAYSFFSKDAADTIGQIGDFVIYSFPKMFPIQIGALLATKKPLQKIFIQAELSKVTSGYVKKVVGHYLREEGEICRKRIDNWDYFKTQLASYDCLPRLSVDEGMVPGVFLFRAPAHIDLPGLKNFLWLRGIQCSVFYGEQTFFVPLHQGLEKEDLDYILANIKEKIAA